jgi:Ca-activated chloride channel family protein
MKGKTIADADLPAANYVFLIDVSGSMDSSDKLGILKSGFKLMTDNLRSIDKVAIVTYSSTVNVLLPSTTGDQKDRIKKAINSLSAGGSTAGAAALSKAYEIAIKNMVTNGNNRVIIGTDGDFNVGAASDEELTELIKSKLQSGIYLTVLGVGEGNLNESMMEQVANKGNGNYEYIDNADQMKKVFVTEKAKFYTVAKDSKIQITFNTNKVDSFRLIGYENRALNNEDFKNDSTDAGEIGSTQTITALYEVVLANNQADEAYAQFDFRYKKPNETDSRLIQLPIKSTPVSMSAATENMRFVASVTAFGLLMKQSVYKGTANKQLVLDLGTNATNFDPNGYRKDFLTLVNKWTVN